MIKDFEQRVAQFLDGLKDMSLVPVQEGDKLSAYYIRKPGTRIMSTLILFTPEGIVLQGDFTPEDHGSVSAHNYKLGWFAGELSPLYLCEKFLQKKWSREVAVEILRDPQSCWREDQEPAVLGKLDDLAQEVEHEVAAEEEIYDLLTDLGFDCCGDLPGWGYDPTEAVSLCAIQRKFAQLWTKREKEISCKSTSTESQKISA